MRKKIRLNFDVLIAKENEKLAPPSDDGVGPADEVSISQTREEEYTNTVW